MSHVRQNGFTMIELMISVAASVLAMLVIYGLFQYLGMQKLIFTERDYLAQGWLGVSRYMKNNYSSIVAGNVAGFANAQNPTPNELFNRGFISSQNLKTSPLHGNLVVSIRIGLKNDLTAVICDSKPATTKGKANDILARRISGVSQNGVFSTSALPGSLSGANFQTVSSPVAKDPAVCVISYLPQQL